LFTISAALVALGLEVQKLGYLRLDAFLVVVQGVGIEQVALLALARGVAYHAGGAAHHGLMGLVAAPLQVAGAS